MRDLWSEKRWFPYMSNTKKPLRVAFNEIVKSDGDSVESCRFTRYCPVAAPKSPKLASRPYDGMMPQLISTFFSKVRSTFPVNSDLIYSCDQEGSLFIKLSHEEAFLALSIDSKFIESIDVANESNWDSKFA